MAMKRILTLTGSIAGIVAPVSGSIWWAAAVAEEVEDNSIHRLEANIKDYTSVVLSIKDPHGCELFQPCPELTDAQRAVVNRYENKIKAERAALNSKRSAE